MISLRHSLWIGTLALGAAIVVGCGGGGTAVTPSAPSAPHGASKTPVGVKIAVVVPAAPRTATAAIKRRMELAQGTDGIQFVIYTHPQASNPVALQTDAFDISSTSSSCTVQNDTSRVCTLSVELSPGSYDVDATTYDTAPSAGVIPGTAHSLGYAALIGFAVAQGAANTMNLSIDGIAASATVTLPQPVVRGLATISQQAAVTVLDANGDVILSNGYVDGSGNPVTVSLSDTATTGLVNFSSTTIATPPPSGVTVSYDPASITSAQMTSNTTAMIAAALSSGGSPSPAPLTILAPAQPIALASPAAHGITAANGIVYVPLSMASHQPQVAAITVSGAVSTFPVATSGATPEPYDIAVGPDGNLWMSDTTGNDILESNISGTSYSTANGFTGGGYATSIVSDGTMTLWGLAPSDTSYPIWEATTEFVTVSAPLAASSASPAPAAMAYNAGNLWITESGANAIEQFSTSSVSSVGRYLIPTASSAPLGIAVGPNGDMWFAETSAHKIGDLHGTSITEYSAGGASPLWVTTGPDGNFWFDYTAPSPGIGRMSASGSTVTLFPLPSGVIPGEMTVSSGLIWIVDTESSNPRVFAIQP